MGTVKINADGAYLKQTTSAGTGVVCRDNVGTFLGGVGRKVEAQTAFEAECLAVRESLLCCNRIHCIEIDCEQLFKLESSQE